MDEYQSEAIKEAKKITNTKIANIFDTSEKIDKTLRLEFDGKSANAEMEYNKLEEKLAIMAANFEKLKGKYSALEKTDEERAAKLAKLKINISEVNKENKKLSNQVNDLEVKLEKIQTTKKKREWDTEKMCADLVKQNEQYLTQINMKRQCIICDECQVDSNSLINHLIVQHCRKEIKQKDATSVELKSKSVKIIRTEEILTKEKNTSPFLKQISKKISKSTKKTLIDHKMSEHDEKKPFKCNICYVQFSLVEDLIDHYSKVHKRKTHSCEICYKVFIRKDLYRKHNAVHEGKKLFKCNECGKSFSRKDNLNEHQSSVHVGKRPFECEKCKTEFKNKAHLTRHTKSVHTKEKPFSCKFCEKGFGRKDHLSDHKSRCPSKPNIVK